MDCIHLKHNFKPNLVIEALSVNNPIRFCQDCKSDTESKWICLACANIGCGRSDKGHALAHATNTGHPISMDLESKGTHCYKHDDYVINVELENEVDVLRKKVSNLLEDQTEDLTNLTKTGQLTGLINLGNTCYMNVILQVLGATTQIYEHFLPQSSPMTPALKGRLTRSSSVQEHTLWTQFRQILLDMWLAEEPAISPDIFVTFVKKKLPIFGGYQQQDSQEFLRALLDLIHEELKERKGKTIIMEIFQGTFENKIICKSCKTVSKKQEPFLDLSLSIPSKESVSIINCLDEFVSEEILDKTEKYYCESCKELREAVKKMTLSKIPPILCLHLKRFKYEQSKLKIDTHVAFFNILDINPYLIDPIPEIKYHLYAIIVHRGSTGSGHYIAYIRQGQEWFEANDRKITKISTEQVLKLPAYMLFYQQEIESVQLSPVPKKRKIG